MVNFLVCFRGYSPQTRGNDVSGVGQLNRLGSGGGGGGHGCGRPGCDVKVVWVCEAGHVSARAHVVRALCLFFARSVAAKKGTTETKLWAWLPGGAFEGRDKMWFCRSPAYRAMQMRAFTLGQDIGRLLGGHHVLESWCDTERGDWTRGHGLGGGAYFFFFLIFGFVAG